MCYAFDSKPSTIAARSFVGKFATDLLQEKGLSQNKGQIWTQKPLYQPLLRHSSAKLIKSHLFRDQGKDNPARSEPIPEETNQNFFSGERYSLMRSIP